MPIRTTDDEGGLFIREFDQQSGGLMFGSNQTNVNQYATILTNSDGNGVVPNPIFVPPSYAGNGRIKVNLLSDSVVSFLEDKVSVGIGKSVVLNRDYHSFGEKRTYRAVVKGKESKNYFVVEIEKTFKTSNTYRGFGSRISDTIQQRQNSLFGSTITPSTNIFNLTFNTRSGGRTSSPTQNDINHKENIVIKEYELDSRGGRRRGLFKNTKFKLKSERRIQSTSGTVDLRFDFGDTKLELDIEPQPESQKLEYEVNFSSNMQNELGEKVNLEYRIVTPAGQFLKQGNIKLSDNNNDLETIESVSAKDAEVHFKIIGDIGDDYIVKSIKYTTNSPNKKPKGNTKPPIDFGNIEFEGIGTIPKRSNVIMNEDGLSLVHGLKITKDFPITKNIGTKPISNEVDPVKPTPKITENWKEVGLEFTATAKELLSFIHIHVEFEKIIVYPKPELSLSSTQYLKEVKDSDIDAIFNLMFAATNADVVNVYLTTDKIIKVEPAKGFVEFSFNNDFQGKYGTKRIVLVPESDEYGTGDRYEVTVEFKAVNDFPSVTEIIHPQTIDIPSFSDGNIGWDVEYETFAATTVDVDLILKDKTKVSLYKNLSPKGSFNINIRDLAVKFPNWNGSDNVTLIFKPYNRGGAEELIGNDYEITTTIIYPSVKLDEDIIRKSIYEAFIEKIGFQEPEKESKHLTHLVNLGNDERILISSWEPDNWTLSEKGVDEFENEIVTKEVKSVILKLYTPLPENVQVNQTIWVSKMMTNPLVETVVLNEQAEIECPPIKGPNFDIEVDYIIGRGTDYESLDNLILSSSSSTELVQSYLYKSDIDTSELNIEYAIGEIKSGSAEYKWVNFVHFSSAEERVSNFVYKVQLIENYDKLITSASIGAQTASLAGQQEIERQKAKKSELIKGFDGFDTFLYTSSSMWSSTGSESMTWPFSGSLRLPSSDMRVIKWYERVSDLAAAYDVENPNWLINNIPQYIRINPENENFLLFFSMVGHHFDNIYYYTKAIERSRGLGYKSEAGLSDKLLYDWLKGFSWDALPLGADSKLWDYAFGLDENGNTRETTSAKKRTNEVWRRIINNLPYLLKHKGTRKGIYALMACYGVPSCNLSVMEFGGPEATDEFKNKVLIDNCSYALKLKASDTISLSAVNTTKTFEAFVKPATAGNYTLLTSPHVLTISGSAGSEYGKVIWNGTESALLPLFNGRYFGVCISNTNLYVAQSEGDRMIFSYSASGVTAAPTAATTITGFSGSIDEIRFWNQPLSQSIFLDHVFYPEMINGNHISASTTDLDVRLDFEYPKNLQSKAWLMNTAPLIELTDPTKTRNYYEDIQGGGTADGRIQLRNVPYRATTSGFTSVTDWPYQFEPIDRNSLIEVPDIGVSRYASNKVRFEEQYLVSDLSPRHRATKKSIQTGPMDSNRVGLFFSPTKELNFDIAKSMGAESLNEYIGDPSDRYKPTYKRLNDLRSYYFSRINNRNIYEYINLVRMYEKAMFDDLKKMLPARVKATTGLLIEPHFLERSKYQYEKPTGSNNYYEATAPPTVFPIAENLQYDGVANYDMELVGDNRYYEAPVDANFSEIFSEPNYYESKIDTEEDFDIKSDYYYYDTRIDAKFEQPTIFAIADVSGESRLAQSDPYVDIGFGLYTENGAGIRTYRDQYGDLKKRRVLANIIVERKTLNFDKYTYVINGKGDPRGGFTPTSSFYFEKKLVVQEWSGSVAPVPPNVVGDIISVTPVDGYLPTHNKNTSDLTAGLLNSYYKGCKNTKFTTLDGSEPVEIFTTNPAALKVRPGGTDSTEPIILVE